MAKVRRKSPRAQRSSPLPPPVPEADVAAVIRRTQAFAKRRGVRLDQLGEVSRHGRSYPLYGLRIAACGGPTPPRRVFIAGTVHGDETAGCAAALQLAERILADPQRRRGTEYVIVPLVNPVGLDEGTRWNQDGYDLNRQFGDGGMKTPEVRAVEKAADRGPFDVAIDLHASKTGEHGRPGFFAIAHSAADALVPALDRFALDRPVLWPSPDQADGFSHRYQFLAPGLATSSNRGTLKSFLGDQGATHSLTLEAPARFAYADRVEGLVSLVEGLLDSTRQAAA